MERYVHTLFGGTFLSNRLITLCALDCYDGSSMCNYPNKTNARADSYAQKLVFEGIISPYK